MELINIKTGSPEDVHPEEVGNKFMSGGYGFKKDQPVFLVDQQGKLDQYVPQDVYLAVTKGGYSFPTEQDLHEHTMQQKYGDRPFSSFAMNAADAATFGGATQLGTKTGLMSQEAAQQIPQRNPISGLAGSAFGIGASLLMSPEAAIVDTAKEALTMAKATGNAAQIAEASKAYHSAKQAFTLADALNPVSAVSKLGQGAADMAAYAPEAATTAQKLLAAGARGAIQGGVEGSLYSLGEVNKEEALGKFHNMDASEMASHVLSQVGFGTVLGGGLGGVLGAGIEAGSLASSKIPSLAEALKGNSTAEASKVSGNAAGISAEAPKMGEYADPFQSLRQKVREANIAPAMEGLPTRQILLDAKNALPEMELPILNVQLEGLENKYARDQISYFSESGSKEAQAFNAYKDAQKNEALNTLKNQLKDLSPEVKLASDEVGAGKKAIEAFQSQYETEKKELAPIFKKFDSVAVKPLSDSSELLQKLEESIPGVSKYLDSETSVGTVNLAKYDPSMPFSKNVYGGIKDIVNSANKEGITLGELRNLRNTLGDRINLLAAPRDAMQLGKIKSSLMDYIGSEIEKVAPDLNVRDTFKRYAINEQNRQVIESIFGGKIGDNVSFAKKIVPEDVIKKLFSDSVTVQAAKEILGPKAFNESLANFVNSQINNVSDPIKNGFSSNKFASFLKSKGPELKEAFKGNEKLLEKMQAATDIMRILPDAPSANPSGTAKAAYSLLKESFGKILNPMEGISSLLEEIKNKGINTKNKDFIAELLNGASSENAEINVSKKLTHYNVLGKMDQLIEKSTKKVKSLARAAVQPTEEAAKKSVGPVAGLLSREEQQESKKEQIKDFNKISRHIGVMVSNPANMLNTLDKSTKEIFSYIPKTSQSVQDSLVKGVSFLDSKLPKPQTDSLFPEVYVPNTADMQKFFKYYDAVQSPLSVLEGLKNNSISSEGIETLQAVYPQLYTTMRGGVIEHASQLKQKPDYQKRLSISMFLGQDVDSSLKPPMIAANQNSFAMMNNGQSHQKDGNIKATQKGIQNLNLASRLTTPMDKAAQRSESRET